MLKKETNQSLSSVGKTIRSTSQKRLLLKNEGKSLRDALSKKKKKNTTPIKI